MPFVAVNAFFLAFAQSDFLGKLIFLGLFVLSALSWVLILYKLWMTRSIQSEGRKFQQLFLRKRHQPLAIDPHALSEGREFSNPFFHVYRATRQYTLEILNKNRLATGDERAQVFLSPADLSLVEAHADVTLTDQSQLLERHLFILSTVVHLAPLLGLLGTVWGITITFSELQGHAVASTNQLVLGGLSMALTTTVLGLVVAIPALIGNSFLHNALKNIRTEVESFAQEVLNAIEMHYRKVDVD